jgi:hypothetical protein
MVLKILHFQTFHSGHRLRGLNVGKKDQVYLVDMWYAVNTMQFLDLTIQTGFFLEFPECPVFRSFTIFHKSGRKIPQALAGFNGTPADHNLIIIDRKTSHNDARIQIVDGMTILAYLSFECITVRYFDFQVATAAIRTKVEISQS